MARLQNKFDEYRNTIESSIETIRQLLSQSKKLVELSNTLEDGESKKTIDDIQTNINASIDKMIDNITKLFIEYESLIKEYARAS